MSDGRGKGRKKKKEDAYCVGVWLSQTVVDEIDGIVKEGHYRSRSELIREAVRDWFRMRDEKIGEVVRNFKK